MLRVFYTLIFIIALPVIFYRLWMKDKKVPGYRVRWPERFGLSPECNESRPIVWVHAVSVGEVVAATPIINRLLSHPNIAVMVTTMTPTGSTRVVESFGDRVLHVYAPYDLPWTVAAFLRRVRPVLAIIMETELWPNMLHVCAKQRVPTILANARLSARSARGYRHFPKTTKTLLESLTWVCVQNQEDGDRFIHLGLTPEKLIVTGSVKFDLELSAPLQKAAHHLKQSYGSDRPIFIAASTHDGEDQIILGAFSRIVKRYPNALLILVPRHPERFNHVVALSQNRFKTLRRSSGTVPAEDIQVIVGDTMGEMMLLYGCADIAFVGGSLIARGGHNPIEPAYWALPILCGPHTFNFADICKRLIGCGGMVTVYDEETLTEQAEHWLAHPDEMKRVGDNAARFADQNRGATDRVMALVEKYLDGCHGSNKIEKKG